VRVLQARGYRVLESASPEKALQISSQERGRIHLLLTDVVMPGMSGRKVAEQIAPLHPNMKVLYMSGYTDDSVFRNGLLETGAAFVQKPFTPSSLARKVREVRDARKPA
jgi:two-component system, cell cycle sensor histidine kinase and response regulator CckA